MPFTRHFLGNAEALRILLGLGSNRILRAGFVLAFIIGWLMATTRSAQSAVIAPSPALNPTTNQKTQSVAPTGSAISGQYRNLFAEAGHSPREVTAKIAAAFQQLFHGDAISHSVYFPVGTNANGALAQIRDINSRDVRSEGMSYGMMIAVQLDRKTEFDALWNWSKTHLQHTATNHPARGYFAWSTKTNGVPNDEMPAPDGEEYYATALLFAAGRWGNGSGIYNYQAEANELLTIMRHRETITGPTLGGVKTAGAMFEPERKMVRFTPDTNLANHTDPSYHLPAFYEVWARYGPEIDREFWKSAATVSRDFFQRAAHPVTGLTPDYSEFDGQPWGTPWNPGATNFVADAWRTAMNWSVDWAWWRADPRECELSRRLLSFFKSQGMTTYTYQFTLDGKPLASGQSAGLISMNAVAALAIEPEQGRPFVEALWNLPVPRGHYRYYDGMLYLFALLNCGGEFRIWSPQCDVLNTTPPRN